MKRCSRTAAILLVALSPFAASAQDDKPNDGTDPTRLTTSFSLSYEALSLPGGGDIQTIFFRYGTPISADGRTGLNLKLPVISTSLGDSGFGVSDLSVKLSRVLTVTPTYGIVLGAEAVFATADAPDRGAGVDALKLSASTPSSFPTASSSRPRSCTRCR